MVEESVKPRFFKTQSDLRKWFVQKHQTSDEIWIGFYRKAAGKTSVSYAEAVDEALYFGWIDGIRKKIYDTRYANRFTPRRAKSNWSKINIQNANRLIKARRMTSAGLKEIARAKADGRFK